MARTPKNYDGTQPTARDLRTLLQAVLPSLQKHYQENPVEVFAAWKEVVGEEISPMTQEVSFQEGVLTVKVKHSTLLSLLSVHEKPRLLKSLRERLPSVQVRTIVFRMG